MNIYEKLLKRTGSIKRHEKARVAIIILALGFPSWGQTHEKHSRSIHEGAQEKHEIEINYKSAAF
jgi:hypothetical protein